MDRGGAERVISLLANHWCDLGYQVKIVLLLGEKCGYYLNRSVEIVSLRQKNRARFLSLPAWIKGIRSIVRKTRPDLLLAFFPKNSILTWLSTRCMKHDYVFVCSERNDPRFDGRSNITKMLSMYVYSKADRMIFQTSTVRAIYSFCNSDRTFVIPNPLKISIKGESVRRVTPGKVVSIGKLEPQKNQKLLIEAFEHFSNQYNDAFLEIYGEGSLREELEALIRSKKLSNKISLMGNVADVQKNISDAEMFVLSSNYEGFSNALMEALAIGIPTISTNCAGSEDLIDDGVSGFIVPVNDRDSMVNAMIRIKENPVLAKTFSANSISKMKKYQSSSILSEWDNACLSRKK